MSRYRRVRATPNRSRSIISKHAIPVEQMIQIQQEFHRLTEMFYKFVTDFNAHMPMVNAQMHNISMMNSSLNAMRYDMDTIRNNIVTLQGQSSILNSCNIEMLNVTNHLTASKNALMHDFTRVSNEIKETAKEVLEAYEKINGVINDPNMLRTIDELQKLSEII